MENYAVGMMRRRTLIKYTADEHDVFTNWGHIYIGGLVRSKQSNVVTVAGLENYGEKD